MKNIRRIIVIALVLATVMASGLPLRAQEGEKEVKLVVFGPSSWDTWAPGTGEETVNQVTEEIDKGFMAENPYVVEIIHDARGTVSDGLSRLMTTQMAGEQIDLIMCAANPVNTSYQPRGLILPVDDLVPLVQDRLIDGALGPFTLNEQVWGIPISGVSATTFFYNKTMFENLGIEPPTTYQEFLSVAEVLRANNIIPVLHQGKNPWMWPIWYMATYAQTTGNKQLEKTISNLRGDTKFTDEEDVLAMTLVRQFVDDGILDPTSMDYDEEGMRSAFISGQAGAYFGATWDLAILTANITDFELGIFMFPQMPDVPGHPVAYGGVEVGLCISSTISDDNLEAAKAYIEYTSRPEIAAIDLMPTNPIATSHKEVLGLDTPIAQQVREEYFPTEKFLDWVWPRELADTIQREVQNVAAGSATPDEAMQSIQAQYDLMVDEGYEYPY